MSDEYETYEVDVQFLSLENVNKALSDNDDGPFVLLSHLPDMTITINGKEFPAGEGDSFIVIDGYQMSITKETRQNDRRAV